MVSRLSVNISTNTYAAICSVAETFSVSATEAIQRLVGYGIEVYSAHHEGRSVIFRGGGFPNEILIMRDGI